MSSNYEVIVRTKNDHVYYDKTSKKIYKVTDGNITEITKDDQEYGALIYILINKQKRGFKRFCAACTAFNLLFISACGLYINDRLTSYVPKVDNTLYSEDTLDTLLDNALNSNKYMCNEAKTYIKEAVMLYINRCLEYGVDYTTNLDIIISNIKKLDGTLEYISRSDTLKEYYLDYIFSFRNGKYIASSIVGSNTKYNYVSNFLFFEDYAMRQVLSGKNITIKLNGLTRAFDLDDIDSLDDEIINALKKYENNIEKEFNLDSIKTNIFSNILENDTYPYARFFEKQETEDIIRLEEITTEHYFTLLANKIYNLPEELDYEDSETRNLVYLYANALLVNGGIQKNFDVTSYIIDSTSDDMRSLAFTRTDLYDYLLGNKLNYNYIDCLGQIGLYKGGVGLLTTVDKCLKIDLECGNLSQKEYDEFYKAAIAYLTIIGGDSLEEFIDADTNDEVLEGYTLQIIPSRTT